MERLKDRVAYLKGLADGLHIDEDTGEGKLLRAIIDTLGDFATVIDANGSVFAEEELTLTCPNCNEEIKVAQSVSAVEEDMLCPACGESIVILNTYI